MPSKKNKRLQPSQKRPGPIIVGSPLYRLLEIIARRVADRLRRPRE